MSLQDQLDAHRADFEAKTPPEIVAVLKAATQALEDTGQARAIAPVGSTAPGFKLTGTSGALVSSAELLSGGPLVITFYRGVWCPYCNLDLKAIKAALPQIEEAGASVVAISPQNLASSRRTVSEIGLPFPVLSDPGNRVAHAFGVRFAMPDPLVWLYKGFGVNLPAINGDDSWTLPMPARFIVDRSGVIRYAEASADYTRRPEPSLLLPVLRELASAT